MESRHLVSDPRIVPRPIFASLGIEGFRSRLGLEGYRSRSQTYCLETWNITRIWLSETVIQRGFSLLQRFSIGGARTPGGARRDFLGCELLCGNLKIQKTIGLNQMVQGVIFSSGRGVGFKMN